ncbi:2-keto-4-pentenoate hydratase/2-oxohepta-3-ene-1,7-dioic acid hydratase (catechol pathway) [Parasphingorhabdus marina DSM 22363]|uniref:2-keto-4-pentenoate hydratase/2-oxohepta-3-ene-1,7-dioic acid hydratase (Catechol pathway) n=1 Tax=Parasphingorhabdus marina DSM 22363 TaxID=1123272 RepID=A0A1N6CSP7_9SPHN|nr:fumarylacetoacetate hydrolase family protein [Parasphingorhabdus marina]SIN61580.1 2-keto-4-pentenoate hydratase/2-oxohepta-3-ene-1,7-dioic acid hydratase (catechol pathway) [Parasphingorhabdus marina DSM 22363]
MKRLGKILITLVLLVSLGLAITWATAPDPKFNPASFEDEPLVEGIAPLDTAVTLAQYRDEAGNIRTIQVHGFSGETVVGTDLAEMGATSGDDPFAALASAGSTPFDAEALQALPRMEVAMSRLLPSGSSGDRHIGTGTNFPEHAEEANSGSVFSFPKFGRATPARTTVKTRPGILLDYEVELCIRFDRDIASTADFDAAMKGVFLCGDFTDRNAIVELVDPDNLDSGSGFSDAKSGPDFFPTGPFLVIPNDWSAFVADLRMTTSVNGEARQDARGREMTLDFRQLVDKSLADMSERRFLYRDGHEYLSPGNRISRESTLMSGTSEGVIMGQPTRGDIIEGLTDYLLAGGPVSGSGLIDTVKQTFIRNELESGYYLQPGDTVRYGSSWLGNIQVTVVD